MTANITSAVTIVKMLSQISYDISWTGSPTGTFAVQVSDTYSQFSDGTVNNPGDWVSLPLSATPVTGGAAGNGMIDILATGTYAMRLVYTFASGTGTLNATISAKVA
jgi:hypothetical protein